MNRKKAPAGKPAVAPAVSEDKLAMIRSGKKKENCYWIQRKQKYYF